MLYSIRSHWRELTRNQKIMVTLQGVIALVFLVLYCVIGTQKYLNLDGHTLRRTVEGNTTVYSGVLAGKQAVLSVEDDHIVTWQLDGVTYGPYTISPDPSAIPHKADLPKSITDAGHAALTGVQVLEGEQVLLQCAHQDSLIFIAYDMAGNRVNTLLPSDGTPTPGAVLKLVYAPNVEARGSFAYYLLGLAFCILTAADILYADDLFRWRLKFIITDARRAEPTEWQLMSRWIAWIAVTCITVMLFLPGLLTVP